MSVSSHLWLVPFSFPRQYSFSAVIWSKCFWCHTPFLLFPISPVTILQFKYNYPNLDHGHVKFSKYITIINCKELTLSWEAACDRRTIHRQVCPRLHRGPSESAPMVRRPGCCQRSPAEVPHRQMAENASVWNVFDPASHVSSWSTLTYDQYNQHHNQKNNLWSQ